MNFLRLTRYRTSEKMALLGERIPLLRTLRYLIPGTVAVLVALLLLTPFFPWSRIFVGFFMLVYLGILAFTSIRGAVQKKSLLVGLGVFFVMPLFHLSIVRGVLSGILQKKAV